MNGQFPSSMAPPALGYCYMTPNQFQSCPDQSIINNPQSLAFQCSVDCIVNAKKKQSNAVGNQLGLFNSFMALLITMATAIYLM